MAHASLSRSEASLTPSASVETLVNDLQNLYQQHQSWKADFEQETYLEMLGKNVSKKGELIVKKPAKLRLEYKTRPKKYYISNGDKLWVYVKGDKQVVVYKNLKKIMADEALSFMQGFADIRKEFIPFSTKDVQEKRGLKLNPDLQFVWLVPREPGNIIEDIIIGVDSEKKLVKELYLFNKSGNRTHYKLSDIKFDKNIDDDEFEFKKKKGIKEVRR